MSTALKEKNLSLPDGTTYETLAAFRHARYIAPDGATSMRQLGGKSAQLVAHLSII